MTRSFPDESLTSGFPFAAPNRGSQVADGVAVVTETFASVEPLLKPITYSRFVAGSMRLTTSTPPFAYRTIVQPVESAGY